MSRFSLNNKVLLFGALFFVLGYFLVTYSSRIGETEVNIEVIPEDSTLKINGSPINSKKVFLSPGKYVFSASKEGFADANEEIEVGEDKTYVRLLPEPTSDEALEWLRSNPDIQERREALGGANAAKSTEEAVEKTPILGALPYEDVTGPFRVDYGLSDSNDGSIYLLISSPLPAGRSAAIDWVRGQGVDPTDYEIRYFDFVNPIVTGGSL